MRPYLAVIVDSFREAFATRVLWITLGLIAVFLLAVAPLGCRKSLQFEIWQSDFRDGRGFARELRKHAEDKDSLMGYLVSHLSEDTRKQLMGLSPQTPGHERFQFANKLLHDVNEALRQRDFYRDDLWADVRLNAEARRLLERRDALSPKEIARLNRLAFDGAFSEYIEPVGGSAMELVYFQSTLVNAPVTETLLGEFVKEVLMILVTLLVGYLGMFVALLVTASMVPQMLESGAVDLLLSKPVSRSLVLLSKFTGGCAFILLNTSFLVVGLWMIVGFRFDVWAHELLWTIPVFVFVFAIFHSVSTLAAVLWRNSIVSIVVAIAFWGVCFTMGLVKNLLDNGTLNTRRTEAILPVDDTLLMTTRDGIGFQWDADGKLWREQFQVPTRGRPFEPRSYPFMGPVYDAANDRLVAIQTGSGRGFFRSRPKLVTAASDTDWKLRDGPDVPGGVQTMFTSDDGVLTAGTDGIYRLAGDINADTDELQIFGIPIPGLGGNDAELLRIDDRSIDWLSPFAAACNPTDNRIAVVSGDTVAVLAVGDEEQYQPVKQITRQANENVVAGFAGDIVVLGWSDGRIESLNAESLKTLAEHRPFGENEPRSITVSPDGLHIAVLYHHRRLWLFDTATQTGSIPPVLGQGDITAVTFDRDGHLFVADQFGRVTKYSDATSLLQEETFRSPPDLTEVIYTAIIRPLHTVFPKPNEMTNVTRWLMTGQETVPTDENNPSSSRVVIDVWQPLWSNLAFLSVTLAVTCVLFSRKDF